MYGFPPSSTGLFPTIVSPSKKATPSTNSQAIQMVTMSGSRCVDDVGKPYIRPVILSAAKDLARRPHRSFAALRMTGRTPLKPAHGKPSLQMPTVNVAHLFSPPKSGIVKQLFHSCLFCLYLYLRHTGVIYDSTRQHGSLAETYSALRSPSPDW